jgi:hypothetical protein
MMNEQRRINDQKAITKQISVIPSRVEAATQWTKSARPGFQSRGEGFEVIPQDPSTSLRMTVVKC